MVKRQAAIVFGVWVAVLPLHVLKIEQIQPLIDASAGDDGRRLSGADGVDYDVPPGGYTENNTFHPWSKEASVQKATDISELWHPYFVLFLLHTIVAFIGVFLSLQFPIVLCVIMTVGGLLWPLSAITGMPIWGYGPPGKEGSFIWWGVFIKWLIVSFFATVPVLCLRAFSATLKQINWVAIFVYFILGSNIIWTLPAAHEDHIVRYINKATGVMLTIALVIHCLALKRHDREYFEVRWRNGERMVYGNGTPFPWLVCYTIWNAFFIAEMSLGSTLQDFLFWILMFSYQFLDEKKQPIELYFAFARPVQLGTYIVFAEWTGTFFPYLRDASTLKEHQPLPVNSHAYFFFLVTMNFLWSFVCTFWTIQEFGLGFKKGEFQQPEDDKRLVDNSDDDVSSSGSSEVGLKS